MSAPYVRPTWEGDLERVKRDQELKIADKEFTDVLNNFQCEVNQELLELHMHELAEGQRQVDKLESRTRARRLTKELEHKREFFEMAKAEIQRRSVAHKKKMLQVEGRIESRGINRRLKDCAPEERESLLPVAEAQAKRESKNIKKLYLTIMKNLSSSSPNSKLLEAYQGYIISSVGSSEREQFLDQIYDVLDEGLW